jgi:hypothetical protein
MWVSLVLVIVLNLVGFMILIFPKDRKKYYLLHLIDKIFLPGKTICFTRALLIAIGHACFINKV